jgi:hypothetical protein
MIKPHLTEHDGVFVARDDLFPGGTKARFLPILFEGANEVVYASPAEGGAQTALATVASQLGKRATIFVAQRASCEFRRVISMSCTRIQPPDGRASSALWLRCTGSHRSYCCRGALHRGRAR